MSHVIKYDRSSHSNEPHKIIETLSYLNVPIPFFNEETAKSLHSVSHTHHKHECHCNFGLHMMSFNFFPDRSGCTVYIFNALENKN